MPSVDADLQQRLEERYKRLFTRIVSQAMGIIIVMLLIMYWQTDDERVESGLIVIAVVGGINFLFAFAEQIPTPWGTIQARSDTVDTLRWSITFLFDAYIVWALNFPEVLAVILWLILTFCALLTPRHPHNKLILASVASICFCILVFLLYPTDLRTEIGLIISYFSLIFILWKLERHFAEEMEQVFAERMQRERIEREAEALQREAAIGHSTRAINHELNNLIGVADLSTERIRKQQASGGDISKDIERLEKSLSYMRKVSKLVLDDLGSEKALKRCISLAELEDDLRLLLCNGITHCQARLEFDFPPNAGDYWFEERTGSTYLILHNLAKNAYEAVVGKFGDQPGGLIRISARVEGERLELSVYDNGVGMSEEQVEDIQLQTAKTSKINGHSLGLRFVQQECIHNNFWLTIEAKAGMYSNFQVRLIQKQICRHIE